MDPNAQNANNNNNNVVNNPCTQQAGAVLGDGLCDSELNIPFCNYDNGDCCQSTCAVLNGVACVGPFTSCVDPTASENAPSASPSSTPSLSQRPSNAPSKVPSSSPSRLPSSTPTRSPSRMPSVAPSRAPSPSPTTLLSSICKSKCGPSEFCGDGFCDEALNNPECGYDGGDCCKGSCVNRVFNCSANPLDYTCRDPTYTKLPSTCKVTNPEYVGDGFCDILGGYNTPDCNYDGGDCCSDTCVPSKYNCSFFACARGLPPGCSVPEPSYIG